MIQANELRIGNYIVFNEDDAISKVIGIHTDIDGVDVQLNDEETYIELRQFSGIELTEEILLKCGFKKKSYLYNLKNYHIDLTNGFFFIGNDHASSGNVDAFIKHLHQLQNLYFALTGKELEVKI